MKTNLNTLKQDSTMILLVKEHSRLHIMEEDRNRCREKIRR